MMVLEARKGTILKYIEAVTVPALLHGLEI